MIAPALRRRILWWVAAVLTLVGLVEGRDLLAANTSVELPPDDPAAAEPSKTRSPAGAPREAQPTVVLRLNRLDARLGEEAPGEPADLFARQRWLPPAKPVVAAAPPPPPPPTAPPFPYTYMGAMFDEGVPTVFFTKGERVTRARQGDTIDGVYRVDEITSTQMKLTYVPLDLPVLVAFGAAP